MQKVFLDAGHGGIDSGAVGNSMQEKNITLPVTLKVGFILKNHGVDVSYSRTTDIFLELGNRATKANNSKSDIFVSIHCNSFSDPLSKGVETYNYPGSVQGFGLSQDIQRSVLESKIYTTNRGTKVANFAVLRLTKMPSALVELAFISNVEDADILRNKQNELAIAVAKGILNYLKIEYKEGKNVDNENIGEASDWAKEAWKWATEKGIVDGINPKGTVTREQVVTMIYRLQGGK